MQCGDHNAPRPPRKQPGTHLTDGINPSTSGYQQSHNVGVISSRSMHQCRPAISCTGVQCCGVDCLLPGLIIVIRAQEFGNTTHITVCRGQH